MSTSFMSTFFICITMFLCTFAIVMSLGDIFQAIRDLTKELQQQKDYHHEN